MSLWRFVSGGPYSFEKCMWWLASAGSLLMSHKSQTMIYNFPPTPPTSVQLTLMLFDVVISSKTWDVHLTSTSPRCVTCVESYGRLATWRQNTCWFPPMHRKECSFVQPTPKQRESEGVGSLRNTYSSWKWEHAFWNIVVSNLRRYWYTPFEREQWKQRGQQFDRP